MEEATTAKREAFRDSLKRKEAEEDLSEALHRVMPRHFSIPTFI